MTLLSLDVTRAIAGDLGIEENALVAARHELRRVLAEPFQARLADPAAPFPAEALLDALEPAVQTLVRACYDQVIRYSDPDSVGLGGWTDVLIRCALSDALWVSLELPAQASGELRAAFRATHVSDEDVGARVDAALEAPLSRWDRLVATLRIFPPPDDVAFGISEVRLRAYAEVVRRQSFWRMTAERLGADGLRALYARAQAFLETQQDLAPVFGRLYDPWLLAHPENTTPAVQRPMDG
jgi:hypothetical protein